MLKGKESELALPSRNFLELVVARHYSILELKAWGNGRGPPKQLWWGLQARMGTLVKGAAGEKAGSRPVPEALEISISLWAGEIT